MLLAWASIRNRVCCNRAASSCKAKGLPSAPKASSADLMLVVVERVAFHGLLLPSGLQFDGSPPGLACAPGYRVIASQSEFAVCTVNP